MKSSIAVKSIFASCLNSLGAISWKLRQYSKDKFLIIMYHHVISKQRVWLNIQAGMYVRRKTFETHLRFLKQHFNIVSTLDFFSDLKHNSCSLNGKPFCILTFDDGWYDFYENTFPILRAFQIPATVFLPTELIGTRKWLWTDRLTNIFFQEKDFRNLSLNGRFSSNLILNQLKNLKGSKESRLEKAIKILKKYRDEDIEEILSELLVRMNLSQDLPGRAFLSWGEVREMGLSGIISFGSHTARHRILTTLAYEEIQDELIRSRERLVAEKIMDPSFIPFSYPNGNYNEEIVKMVEQTGFSLAVTTKNGWNRLGSNLFTLRRIAVHQDISYNDSMFGCRIANIF